MTAREKYVKKAESFVGERQGSEAHIKIINEFNILKPDGWAMTYTAPWCATFASAVAMMTFGVKKAKEYFPLSANCGRIIDKAKRMKIWKESDAYSPRPGDWVLYDWDDSGYGDNHGSPDHVGIVKRVNSRTIYVIEGNKGYPSEVGIRKIPVNGIYIRGFVTPNFPALDETPGKSQVKKTTKKIAEEVIAGKWGNGDERKKKLKAAGYDYQKVQAEVNKILKGAK